MGWGQNPPGPRGEVIQSHWIRVRGANRAHDGYVCLERRLEIRACRGARHLSKCHVLIFTRGRLARCMDGTIAAKRQRLVGSHLGASYSIRVQGA